MTTYTEDDLRAEAHKLRQQADAVLTQIGRMLELADQMDAAAAGRISQEQLQAAVDAIAVTITDPDPNVLGDRMDAAFDAEDFQVWAQAASELLLLLSADEVAAWAHALNNGLVASVAEAIHEFKAMPAASEARQ